MLRPIVRTGLTLFVLAYFFPSITYTNWITLVIMAVILTLMDSLVKPILNVLLLPVNVITFGLFSSVINAFVLWLTAYLVPGFRVADLVIAGIEFNQFFTYLILAALIGMMQSFMKALL